MEMEKHVQAGRPYLEKTDTKPRSDGERRRKAERSRVHQTAEKSPDGEH